MSIRNEALQWYKTKYGRIDIPIYTSKYYQAQESWPKRKVWWPQIPLKAISDNAGYVHILCQVAPGKSDFHHLKVPTKFLKEHLKQFHSLKEKISLYLSADPQKLFIEERGEGSLNFKISLS